MCMAIQVSVQRAQLFRMKSRYDFMDCVSRVRVQWLRNGKKSIVAFTAVVYARVCPSFGCVLPFVYAIYSHYVWCSVYVWVRAPLYTCTIPEPIHVFLHALHTRVCADDELWRPIESHRRHRSLSAWLPTRVPSFRNNLFVKAFGYAWKKCVFLRLILIRFPLRSYSAVMFNGIESWILRIIPEDMACHAPKDFNYDKIDLHSFSYINFCVLCKYVQLAKSEWQTVEVGGESGQRHARMTRGLHARGTRVAVLPRV